MAAVEWVPLSTDRAALNVLRTPATPRHTERRARQRTPDQRGGVVQKVDHLRRHLHADLRRYRRQHLLSHRPGTANANKKGLSNTARATTTTHA